MIISSRTDGNNPKEYDELPVEVQQALEKWILAKFEVSKRIYKNRTSYGLKHDFQRDTRIYTTNGQFKGAMLAAGFTAADEYELNWHFKVKERIPEGFYKWCLRYQYRDSTLSDFAKDMKTDFSFPKESDNKDEINDYLRRRGACNEARIAFQKAWKNYEKWKAKQNE